MRSTTLPGAGMQLSQISLGTAALGTVVPRDESYAILDAYVEAGGVFIDTAHVYADWIPGERHVSERTIGAWLRARGGRDRLVIATKGGHPDLATPLVPRLAPEQIAGDLDESLACLGIEQIDLYWLHRDDPQRPVGEILETLNEQMATGRVRAIGCSNWQPERIRAAHAYAAAHGLRSFVASQIFWSLAVPNPGAFPSDHALMDDAALAFYADAGLAVTAFTAQARGFFAKAAAGGIDALKPAVRADFENVETLARLGRVRTLSQRLGAPVTSIVLAYIYSHPFPSIPIIGPRSLAQLRESLAGADLALTAEQVRYLASGQE